MDLPSVIYSGNRGAFHVQGICLDREHKYIYYSFTTTLVKMDLEGNLIGSVKGLTGHLGCIAMNPEDGLVYGSLEYKNDVIGRGIMDRLGRKDSHEDAFYIAVFDPEKIVRPDMDAEKDGVMKAVYLKEVVDDYHAVVENSGRTVEHRHGCSGIDGITFAPVPGTQGPLNLMVTYGVYGDLTRTDNDYQVILSYDFRTWAPYLMPLSAEAPHTAGPEKPDSKFFVFTGNTVFGVQNMEYDAYTGNIFLCVYCGHKPQYPNHPLYVIDGSKAPAEQILAGVEPTTTGKVLSLWGEGELPGFDFPDGNTGFYSLGDGRFYVSKNHRDENGRESSTVTLYRYTGTAPLLFESVCD